ncbi:MAG: flippase [Acidobacteriia bacterium]|nr:flippase [Terriglobia bacterium]
MTSAPPGVSRSETAASSENGALVTPITSGRLLAGNTLWNLFGTCFPILVAIACLPVLKRSLGTDRLGVISLAWVVIGYFGLFDLGLSRALTKLVAERLGQEKSEEIPALIWTSLALMAGVGLVGAAITLLCTPFLLHRLLKVPVEIFGETLHAFYWMSAAIPVVVATTGLRGVLEALQKFRLATAIRVPMGVFTYLGPVMILPFSHSLASIMAVLVLGRIAAFLAHLWACARVMPNLSSGIGFHAGFVGPLMRFGTWMSISNLVGPLMVYFDRFVVGGLISMSAVAYYSVPNDVVTKLTLVPSALVGVLFPAFSATADSDRSRLIFLYECGVKYLFLLLFPVTLVLIAFAPEALRWWLGPDFAQNSAPVAQALAVAVFLNSLGQIPFAHVQSCGRPDITAKLHLMELPIYMAMLFWLARSMGIKGVAIAWLVRVALDTVMLFLFSWQLLRENRFVAVRLPLLTAGALACFGSVFLLQGMIAKIAVVTGLSVVAGVAMWFRMLSPRERNPLTLRMLRSPGAVASSANCASVPGRQ